MTARRPSTRFVPLSEGQHALALAAENGPEALAALLAAGEAPDTWAAEPRTFRVPRSAWALRRAAQWARYQHAATVRALRRMQARGYGLDPGALANAERYARAADVLAAAARRARK